MENRPHLAMHINSDFFDIIGLPPSASSLDKDLLGNLLIEINQKVLNHKIKKIDKVILGFSLKRVKLYSYKIQKIILSHLNKDLFLNSEFCAYNSQCLTTSSVVSEYFSSNKTILYMTADDLADYSSLELMKMAHSSYDNNSDSALHYDYELAHKYHITTEDQLRYLTYQNNIGKKYGGNCRLARYKYKNELFYLSVLSGGIGYFLLSREVQSHFNIMSVVSITNAYEKTDIHYLTDSILKAARNANIRIADIDYFEISDSHPVFLLGIVKHLNIPLSKVNLLGSVFLRGNTITGAGIQQFANVKTLFKIYKDYEYCCIVNYSYNHASSIILRRTEYG